MSELATLMGDALEIMLVGMISVFAFLALLVWLVGQMGRFVQSLKLAPAPQPQLKPAAAAVPPSPPTGIPSTTVAAISTAVHRYRQQHQHSQNNPSTPSPQ